MIPGVPRRFAPTQVARLRRFKVTRSPDIHCHVLPGIDDGPRTIEESLALCRMLVRDGFTDVIATPHQLGRYDGTNWAEQIRADVEQLQAQLDQSRIPLQVHAGGEVRLDERIPRMLQDDRLLTLADAGKFFLLELPTAMAVRVEAVESIMADAPTIVLAHAERYEMFKRDPISAEGWLEANIALQVNASSLLPESAGDSQRAAMLWLEHGWVSLIATDAHNAMSRPPRMTEAMEILERHFGPEIAAKICIENPARLLPDESMSESPSTS